MDPSPVRRRLPLASAVVVVAGLLALPAGAPPPARAIGELPACRLDDVLTVPRGYDDWSTTLVDWMLRVGADYVPPDLVPVSDAGIPGSGMIRAVTIDDLRAMGDAARAAGAPIGVWSPYRSYDEQVEIFNNYASAYGYDNAITYSMRPGHSEHQLGLGIDFMSAGGGSPLIGDWAYETKAGAWMEKNAWKYGWVMSYPIPPDQVGTTNLWSDATCFTYEPWHYRYLGRAVARAVHDSGLTIREYLWANYTQLDVNLDPIATPTPTPSPTPTSTPEPTVIPTLAPTPTAIPLTTPSPTAAPSAGGTWFGVRPPVALLVGGGLLVLALGGFAAWRGALRR
jgi:zinc D-Ala-D-Ala carboxypeptidase